MKVLAKFKIQLFHFDIFLKMTQNMTKDIEFCHVRYQNKMVKDTCRLFTLSLKIREYNVSI